MVYLWPASGHYPPKLSKGLFKVKIRAKNESYFRNIDIITVIIHSCKFTLASRDRLKKS